MKSDNWAPRCETRRISYSKFRCVIAENSDLERTDSCAAITVLMDVILSVVTSRPYIWRRWEERLTPTLGFSFPSSSASSTLKLHTTTYRLGTKVGRVCSWRRERQNNRRKVKWDSIISCDTFEEESFPASPKANETMKNLSTVNVKTDPVRYVACGRCHLTMAAGESCCFHGLSLSYFFVQLFHIKLVCSDGDNQCCERSNLRAIWRSDCVM